MSFSHQPKRKHPWIPRRTFSCLFGTSYFCLICQKTVNDTKPYGKICRFAYHQYVSVKATPVHTAPHRHGLTDPHFPGLFCRVHSNRLTSIYFIRAHARHWSMCITASVFAQQPLRTCHVSADDMCSWIQPHCFDAKLIRRNTTFTLSFFR